MCFLTWKLHSTTGYVEEDVQLSLLTPNALQFGHPSLLPEKEDHHIEDRDLQKYAKYLRRCKEVL